MKPESVLVIIAMVGALGLTACGNRETQHNTTQHNKRLTPPVPPCPRSAVPLGNIERTEIVYFTTTGGTHELRGHSSSARVVSPFGLKHTNTYAHLGTPDLPPIRNYNKEIEFFDWPRQALYVKVPLNGQPGHVNLKPGTYWLWGLDNAFLTPCDGTTLSNIKRVVIT
jgi:hypothetical protein